MRRLSALVLALALAIVLTACGGKPHQAAGSDLNNVQNHLKAAKANLDRAAAISFTLTTTGISASGYGTHQPAFTGNATTTLGSVKIIAVGDKVWADGPPLFQNWTELSSAELQSFGFPNPASLLSTNNGLSSLLTYATGLNTGQQTRKGSEILTAYSGTVSGPDMHSVLSSADPQATYSVTFKLTSSDQLVEAVLTGPLAGKSGSATYDVTVADCATCAPITAPVR